MLKVISYSISIVMIALNVSAMNVDSFYVKNDQKFQKVISIQCDNDDSQSCQELCSDSVKCSMPEPYCLNCSGTTWGFLRSIFTQPSKQYVADYEIFDTKRIVRDFKSQRLVLVDSKSVFNYYTPIQAESLVKSMNGFCPESTENTFFALGLNTEHVPVNLQFVVCKASGSKDLFFSVRRAEAKINNEILNLKIDLTNK